MNDPTKTVDVPERPSGARYERRRLEIIDAATRALSRDGVRGMRLAAVASQLGLTTNSVSYYYRRKEDLAVACFEAALEVMGGMIDEAAQAGAPPARVGRFLELYLQAHARMRRGEQPPISIFSDLRTLTEPQLGQMEAAYKAMQRQAAALFEGPGLDWMDQPARLARAQLLLEQGYWSEVWLPRYSLDDLPRVHARLCDILLNGLAGPGRAWAPAPLAALAPGAGQAPAQENFLKAATRLVNQRGYRGASVSGIAAELNVTKGSFYHHHHAKDELVLACFRRSYRTMRSAQRAVREAPGDEWLRLSTAVASLVEHQFLPEGPLLRTSALAAIPPEMRMEAARMSRRVTDHFAAMIADGIAEGSLRAVDPAIAAEALAATINAASDLPFHMPVDAATIAELYARPLLVGLFTE